MKSTGTIEYLCPVDKVFKKSSLYTSKSLFAKFTEELKIYVRYITNRITTSFNILFSGLETRILNWPVMLHKLCSSVIVKTDWLMVVSGFRTIMGTIYDLKEIVQFSTKVKRHFYDMVKILVKII